MAYLSAAYIFVKSTQFFLGGGGGQREDITCVCVCVCSEVEISDRINF